MTFIYLESCKKFVEAEQMLYKEVPLLRKFQKDYLEGMVYGMVWADALRGGASAQKVPESSVAEPEPPGAATSRAAPEPEPIFL